MSAPISFVVPGSPKPKQRARRGRTGRWFTPKATVAYEAAVGWAAREAGIPQCTGPVRLAVSLWFPDRRRRDIDNCAKAILDGLTGVAWGDDSQVAELAVTRDVDRHRPRAVVTVESLP